MSATISTGRSAVVFGLVFLLFSVLLPGIVRAEGTELVRYWQVEGVNPDSELSLSGRTPLHLAFIPQENLCAAEYGDQWYAVCARSTGMAGRPAPDVTLDPPLPGTWRWTDDRLLSFTPFTDWPAGTRYNGQAAGIFPASRHPR